MDKCEKHRLLKLIQEEIDDDSSISSMIFPVVMYGCESWTVKKAEHWRTVALEKTLESPLDCKEIQPVHSKGDQPWMFFGGTDAEAETPVFWPPHAELTHWKRPWCCEGLGTGGEGDDRGWDGWMASPTRWTWVWVSSRSWWWTGRPGVLQFVGSQRVRRLNWTELKPYSSSPNSKFILKKCFLDKIHFLFCCIFLSLHYKNNYKLKFEQYIKIKNNYSSRIQNNHYWL